MTRAESRPSSSNSHQRQATTIEGDKGITIEGATLTGTQESSSSYSIVHGRKAKPIKIDSRGNLHSVVFLDGKRIVSGGDEGTIQCWRVEDGREVRTPVRVGSPICDMAVSRDGKWVVCGTASGQVAVWDVESGAKVTMFKGRNGWVCAVDVSPDGTRIASGSTDETVCVWSLEGRRLLSPLRHHNEVLAVKFSPDGRLIATATWERESVRIYDSRNGCLLVDFPIQVCLEPFSWATDSKQLFALSTDGNANCLDVPTGTTLSKWRIQSNNQPRCIALAGNGIFIAVSDLTSVSFWDTTTHQQIGSVINHTHDICSMSLSANYDIVTCGNQKIALRNLCDILPSLYYDDMFRERAIQRMLVDGAHLEGTVESLDEKTAILERALQQLRDQLSDSRRTADEKQGSLTQAIHSLRTQDERSKEIISDLERTVQELRNQLSDSQYVANQREDGLTQTIQSLRSDLRSRDESSNKKIASLDKTIQQHRAQLTESRQNAQQLHNQLAESRRSADQLGAQLAETQQQANRERDTFMQIIRAHEQKHQCEALYAQGRTFDAARSFLEIANTMSDSIRANKLIMDWISEFTNRCISKLETIGNEESSSKKHDEALAAYSIFLSLGPSTPNTVLTKWASAMLIRGSVNEALSVATKFKLPRFTIYRAICDVLEGDDRVTEAIICFRQMQSELAEDTSTHDERVLWELNFRGRCVQKLEKLGDTAIDCKSHDEAIRYYSNALSLDPMNPSDILVKCCKARAGLLQEALVGATKVIEDDPSSYKGYKRKHAALHAMGRHKEAFGAFEKMLSKLEESPDPHIRELRHQYVNATPTIRRIVRETIRDIPRILIDTATGRLYNKTQQAAAFEHLPIYNELRSTMTTRVDNARIREEVKKYYRYVMFSHRWEDGEPLFQRVENISIYELESSSPNIKLQTLCTLVRSLGLQWMWSDTCCIDKKDNVVLQESLVAMFAWYRGSSLTIVYLRGVWSQFQKPGALRRSIWNTRAWTYQEYVAAETVQFYTEDWKPYLGSDTFNHKDSPDIVSEMQQAAGPFTQDLAVLRPSLERVREKLYLASTRQTTLTEDIAYSLLGIFNAAIPVIYGEGNRAVGRLLDHILTGSGDVTILAWTGRAGSYNSCLPTDLVVYNQLVPPHVPQPIEIAEMDNIVTALRSSWPDLSPAMMLHGRLEELPSAFFAASRLRLPGIVFSITELDDASKSDSDSHLHVYRATTAMLGDVEIKTMVDLSGMKNLILIHPWVSSLLEQEFSHGETWLDNTTRALRLVALLRQPFGALLLSPLSRVRYRRVAADSLIMVRVREETPLKELMEGIRVVDIQ